MYWLDISFTCEITFHANNLSLKVLCHPCTGLQSCAFILLTCCLMTPMHLPAVSCHPCTDLQSHATHVLTCSLMPPMYWPITSCYHSNDLESHVTALLTCNLMLLSRHLRSYATHILTCFSWHSCIDTQPHFKDELTCSVVALSASLSHTPLHKLIVLVYAYTDLQLDAKHALTFSLMPPM